MSSKPPPGSDLPSVDEFETGVLQGASEGAKSMVTDAVDLYKAGERAADVAQRALIDPQVRQKVWSKTKQTGRDIKQFGQYIAEEPAARIVAAKNGVLAAENKAEEWLKKEFNDARGRGEGSTFVGRVMGRIAFEIGSLFVGLGEASEAGKLAEAERGIAKAIEVTECPLLRAERGELAANEAAENLLGRGVANEAAGREAVEYAKSLQGKGVYTGIDEFKPTTLKPGDIVAQGDPGPGDFFTTMSDIESAGKSRDKLWQGLQVEAHPKHGYRSRMKVYRVKSDTVGAAGKVSANPQFGEGGLNQVVVKGKDTLEEIGTIELGP